MNAPRLILRTALPINLTQPLWRATAALSLLCSSGLLISCSGGRFEQGPGSDEESSSSNAESESNSEQTASGSPEAGAANVRDGGPLGGATGPQDGGQSNNVTATTTPAPTDDPQPTEPQLTGSESEITESETEPPTPSADMGSDSPPAPCSPEASSCTIDAGSQPAPEPSAEASDQSSDESSSSATEPPNSDETSEPETASSSQPDADPSSETASDSESETTSDSVTEPDVDECPDTADQQLRGSCGCGFDPSTECEYLESHLVHRYSFDGNGTTVVDSVGDDDGEAVDVQLNSSGSITLDGSSQYVELPTGLASQSASATLEMWLVWHGGDDNQRVFNFGTPRADASPLEYLSLTPAGGNSGSLTASFRTGDDVQGTTVADNPLATGSLQHITVVFDSAGSEVLLYLGTELVANTDTAISLVDLADQVNWLGRPLYSGYPTLDGELLEFRIYDTALEPEQVAQSDALGESATFSTEP